MCSDLPSEQPNMNFHASIGWFNQMVDHLLEPASKKTTEITFTIKEQYLPPGTDFQKHLF